MEERHFEYALNNSELPSLSVSLRICRTKWEMQVLVDCLFDRQQYEMAHRMIAGGFGDRDFWLKSADFWGANYLDGLRQLEAMQ